MNTINALADAFRALSAKQRANLLWHVGEGTKIMCGPKRCRTWADGTGGA